MQQYLAGLLAARNNHSFGGYICDMTCMMSPAAAGTDEAVKAVGAMTSAYGTVIVIQLYMNYISMHAADANQQH
jgi:hypothetical protein